jgi:hypothetical protein
MPMAISALTETSLLLGTNTENAITIVAQGGRSLNFVSLEFPSILIRRSESVMKMGDGYRGPPSLSLYLRSICSAVPKTWRVSGTPELKPLSPHN